MNLYIMDLKLFDDPSDEGNGGTGSSGGTGNTATYTHEQLETIASSRAERAERAALSNFFKSQGMSQDEINQAINDFKEKRKASAPDVAQITKERDEALAAVEGMKNSATLKSLGVQSEFEEFVLSKISANVTKDKDFAKAAEEYKKENPQYFRKAGGMKVSSTSGTGGESSGGNATINDMIRNRARH